MNDLEVQIVEGFKIYFALSDYEKIKKNIHTRISEQCGKTPGAIAVQHNDNILLYSELEEQANVIANFLIANGIQAEECIGICLKESVLLPVVILGILKAGGVYVPLASDFPVNRIDKIIKDASISIIFTNDDIPQLDHFTGIHNIKLDRSLSSIENKNNEPPNVIVEQNQTAYIIYTSGSTGDPKGVEVEHRSIINYLDWYLDDLQSQSRINLPLTSSVNFAAGVTQLYSPLLLGKTLHIIDRDIVKNPLTLLEWYNEHPGHGIYCVPTLWEEILNYAEQHSLNDISPPECLFLSGEALHKSIADRTFRIWPHIRIWNLYGPTEATANVSYYAVQQGEDIYLGRPIRGARIFLLDEDLKEVPQGQEGYIYITSQALARSYRNKPELTDKNFIRHHQLPGYEQYTLYNTGDVGKFDEKGQLVFLGRSDQQVKIRGHRIELQEVEKYLGMMPGIRQVACKTDTDSLAQSRIVAYVVSNGQLLNVNDIRAHMAMYVPEHYIPEEFVFLDEMPKLANGKINKKLLKTRGNYSLRPRLSYDKTEASSAEEKKMLQLCEEVLGFSELGMQDNFFDIGAHSIKLMRLLNVINKTYRKQIEIHDIWKNPTPAALLEVLNTKKEDSNSTQDKPTRTSLNKKSTSLSFTQTGMWFIMQTQPDQTAYNILFKLELVGNLDAEHIKKALQLLVARQDMLRSNFMIENRTPVRFITDKDIDYTHTDISHKDAAGQADYENELVSALFAQKLHLEKDNLISFRLLKTKDNQHKLLVRVHHIIFDGASINIFIRDFQQYYNLVVSNNNDKGLAITPLEYNYAHYEQWLKKRYFEGKYTVCEDFWKDKLASGNFYLNFPYDKTRPKVQGFEGRNKELFISKELFQKIKEFNKQVKSTPFITLLSVFKLLLHRYSNERDIIVGVPYANRTLSETESIIGLFMNTMVYRTTFNKNLVFTELLDHIRQYTLEALQHQEYPFEKMVESLKPERSVSYNPVFQMMFAYNEKLESKNTDDGIVIEAKEILNPACKFDLDVEAQEYDDHIVLTFNYNTTLFEDITVDAFMHRFLHILEQVLIKPDMHIIDYELEASSELDQKLHNWNDTECSVPETFAHRWLEDAAIRTPEAIALHTNNKNITYAELNVKANALASRLVQMGIRADNIVGIITDRSIDMMVGAYAILKAGAAYLPISPAEPEDRVQYMIADSNSKIVLTKSKFDSIDIPCTKILLDDEKLYDGNDTKNPEVVLNPDNLAYVIYTSGSTGKPKCVMIEHRALVNRMIWMQKAYPLTDDDIVIQKTPYTFDVSVWELFWPALTGNPLHLLESEGEKNPQVIIEAIVKHGLTTIHFVPSMFNVFLQYINDNKVDVFSLKTLKRIFTSGEVIEMHLVEEFNRLIGKKIKVQLINLYGPTEATVDVTHFDCNNAGQYSKVPIGKPIDNTSIYIVDEQNRPLLAGIPGELCIGGIGLARGYISAELTAEKFIENPYTNCRVYKTGDKARWLHDGNIEYLGRLDNQVKIRGFRVELGEIENCLKRHVNIEAAIVTTKQVAFDDVRIVAYCILKDKKVKADFNAYLRNLLPHYMIPSAYVELDKLPLLSNGKVNMKELPEPYAGQKRTIGEREYYNDYERQLAMIWNKVLKTDAFTTTDNFYDVGGYSLLLIKTKYLIDEEFKADIPIVDLFQYPTIRSLAEVIATKSITQKRSHISNRSQLQRKSYVKLKKN